MKTKCKQGRRHEVLSGGDGDMDSQNYPPLKFIFSAGLGRFFWKHGEQDNILIKVWKKLLKLEGIISSTLLTGGDKIFSIPPPVAPPMSVSVGCSLRIGAHLADIRSRNLNAPELSQNNTIIVFFGVS